MKELSYPEIKSVFEKLGFRDFEVVSYDDVCDKRGIPFDEVLQQESYAKRYLIDVLPTRVKDEFADGVTLLELHYQKPENRKELVKRWCNILVKFLCYSKLEYILVAGFSIKNDDEFGYKTKNGDGYLLKFPARPEFDLEDFLFLVKETTWASVSLIFQEMTIRYYPDEFFLVVDLDEHTRERRQNEVDLLKQLASSEGLFLR